MKLNIILIVVLVLLFCFNSVVLSKIYPLAATDYNEWLKYHDMKIKIYEFMFATFFLSMAISNKGALRALCIFGLLVSFASAIDKIILLKNQYLYSDIGVVLIAGAASIYGYFKWRK